MKRAISLLLCALLLAALPTAALAAQGDVLLRCGAPDDAIPENILSTCPVGDALYMLGANGGLYVLMPDASEPQAHALTGDCAGMRSGCLLARGDQLLLLALSDGGAQVQATLCSLENLADGGMRAKRIADVDLAGGFAVGRALAVGDAALLVVDGEMGARQLLRLDLGDGSTAPPQCEIGAVYALAPYTDERALICAGWQDGGFRFLAYDPAADSADVLGETDAWSGALACDPATGAAYCARDGAVCPLDLATGAMGEAVATAPSSSSTSASAWILPSGRFAFAHMDACARVGLENDLSAMRRLTVLDESYTACLDEAYYAFAGAHGDAAVTLVHGDTGDLLDSMLSRDASVDIYVLPTSSEAFAAARARGYMADLSQSPALAELAQRLYPGVRDGLSSDGAFAALPLDAYFWQMRVNEDVLAKLGRTLEDVPRNWSDFVDFLLEIQADFPQDGSVTLMDSFTSAADAREALFYDIFGAYQRLLAEDPDAADAETMTGILEQLEQVDFARMGQPASDDAGGTMAAAAGAVSVSADAARHDAESVLLTMNSGCTLAAIDDAEGVPLVMSLTAQTPARLEMECYAAFVNPYSEDMALALAFMEELAQRLPPEVSYAVCADLTEPVPDPDYERRLADAQAELERARQAAAAADPIDRQALEDTAARIERYVQSVQSEKDLISAAEIAWLREHAGGLAVKGPNSLYAEGAGDAYELVRQYSDGGIDAAQLMNAVDGMVRMMLAEQR